jgi:flagellar hook-associated protein 2
MDWKSVVSELADAERAAETPWQTQQSALNAQNAAYTTIKSDLTTLQADVKALQDASLYQSSTAQSSNPAVATASTAVNAALGTFTFNIAQLASAAKINGATGISQPLVPGGDLSSVTIGTAGFATPVTAGTFTINGTQITIAATDSLQDVFDRISAAGVTAAYDADTDEITLTSTTPGQEIILGSATDTSNFLQAAQLYNNGADAIRSASALGSVRLTAALADADLATAITGDANGQGQFTINGVTISYNLNTDNLNNVLDRINSSAAGVTASYDALNNRFVLTNKATGDMGISLQDVTGNFLAATGLSGGALVHGQNLLYTLNGSSRQLVSASNTITADSSGITGLSVTALQTGAATVNVSSDTSKASAAIQKFITDYNAVQTSISAQQIVSTGSDGTVTPGTLTGDLTASGIASGLRSAVFSPVTGLSGAIQMLASLGIQTNGQDNTLTLSDPDALNAALANHLTDVRNFFTATTNGWAAQLNTFLDKTIGDDGTIPTHQASLTKQVNNLTDQINALEKKIASDSAQWTQAFQAMEQAQSKVNQELTYLSQQVSNGSL